MVLCRSLRLDKQSIIKNTVNLKSDVFKQQYMFELSYTVVKTEPHVAVEIGSRFLFSCVTRNADSKIASLVC